MKNIKYFVLSSVLVLPVLASAATVGNEGTTFILSIQDFINGVLIPFIFVLAFLAFVWGMFQYFIAGGANEEAKEKGKSLLIYSIVGFVVIIAFWGIINLVIGFIGIDGTTAVPTLTPPAGAPGATVDPGTPAP
jgi:hypothetical protein